MIRNFIVAPIAILLRALVRAALTILDAGTAWVPGRVVRQSMLDAAAALLEAMCEYVVFVMTWAAWAVDWIVRWPAVELGLRGYLGPAVVTVRGVFLKAGAGDPSSGLARMKTVMAEAANILLPHGLALVPEEFLVVAAPRMRLPAGGFRGVAQRFFTWASARAPTGVRPRITIYFVENLGSLAGCAFPGTDWIVVDLRTDGTTVVHEIGHLADLWRHSEDPENVMTDRPGGRHTVISPRQAAMLRSARFVRPR